MIDNFEKDFLELNNESNYYVGIGASAGGLEALQEFFSVMPADSGMVFIVIQHLSPEHKSFMSELLGRHTNIPIKVAEDGMKTEANTIYLIPPGKNLSIFHQKLFLEDQDNTKGLRLPIDIFFRSLAADKGRRAIGVILSGTGSDGTLGVRAIKEAGGLVLVQDDSSAKFHGMPHSSISTGLVDYILPPSEMAEALRGYIKHPFIIKKETNNKDEDKNLDTLTKIIYIIKDYCGIDFSYYKENTIIRRIERRISINRLNSLEEYLSFISNNSKEKEIIYKELLIGVTRFFRDTEAFDSIYEKVIPTLLNSRKEIRVWSVACSTGEEVYSLAMLFKEYISKNNLECEVKIFATDVDSHSIEIAGQGLYSESMLADVEPRLLDKYFILTERGYKVTEEIRKMVVFATHNILKDPPFSKLDLLVCRNVFIYLKPNIQQHLLTMFYYSLKPDGFLFLGNSESVGGLNDAYTVIDSRWRIYQCKEGYISNSLINNYPYARNILSGDKGIELPKLRSKGAKIEKLMDSILSSILSPSVLVDAYDNIIHIINDMNPFLKIRPGMFSQNIFSNLPSEISIFVSNVIRRLKSDKKDTILENITGVRGFENKKINIYGKSVSYDQDFFYLLSFEVLDADIDSSRKEGNILNLEIESINKVTELEKELQVTKDTLRATVEELETSNEELQSSNEELIASNEELQSTNEELQSVNEELYTVNYENQLRIDELTRLNSDLDNLITNIEVGALYLDRSLCIRKITPIVTKITNIIPNDIGRPISHIAMIEKYKLMDDIENVMENINTVDREIVDSYGNTWLTRLRPYRSKYNAIEGVMMTFVEVTKLRVEKEKAINANRRLEEALKIGNMAWFEWDVTTGEVIYDEEIIDIFGYRLDEFPSHIDRFEELIHPEDYPSREEGITKLMLGEENIYESAYRIRCNDGSYRWCFNRAGITERDKEGNVKKVANTIQDISRFKSMEEEVLQKRLLLEKVLDNSPIAKTMVNSQGVITYANRKAEEVFRLSRQEILDRTYDSSKWVITDLEGRDIPANKLPFELLKKGRQPIQGYKHYIEVPGNEKVLLKINGVPIIGADNNFEGAVFTLDIVEER